MNITDSKSTRKSVQTVQTDENFLTTAIVIPKEITTSLIHQKIEEYQLSIKFSSDPRITKPGAAYALIVIGLKHLGLVE